LAEFEAEAGFWAVVVGLGEADDGDEEGVAGEGGHEEAGHGGHVFVF